MQNILNLENKKIALNKNLLLRMFCESGPWTASVWIANSDSFIYSVCAWRSIRAVFPTAFCSKPVHIKESLNEGDRNIEI